MDPREAERKALLEAIEADAAPARALACWMAEHPELALVEHEASARYRAWLSTRGFRIEVPVAELETAFVAEHGAADAPFAPALLAEMDALPGLGHACGHNLSGPASLLAASALAKVLPASLARIRVIGCPAEEIGVGKRRLAAAGAFAATDVAVMAHAGGMRRAHRLFLGNRKLELVFHGRAAHAAAYPERGINALDAVIALFVGIGLLRQQLPRGVRIHGIITDGGKAPNIIPERAAATTGARLEVLEEEGTSPPLLPNLTLADTYRRQLQRLGLEEFGPGPQEAIGSSDITHVSRVVPTIHPNFPIGEGLEIHSRAFADAAASARGLDGLLEAARAVALTVHELAHDPALRAAIAAEFSRRSPPQAAE